MMFNYTFFLSWQILLFVFGPINENKNVYEKSILHHISNTQMDTVYVIKCADIDLKLPSKLSKYFVVEIHNIKEFMEDKENLYVLKLMPIVLDKDKINISIIDYLIEKNDAGEINLSYTGSEIFTYGFNLKKKVYELIKRKKNTI